MSNAEKGTRLQPKHRWTIDDIDFGMIDHALVKHDTLLFFMLASASFVEITSDLYTHNLVDYFHDDRDAVHWLSRHWQYEEVQHGEVLKTYVNTVWPEFDWQTAYDDFSREYSRCCTVEQLEPSPGLEMAARCVVETGTSCLYATLQTYTSEPVLKRITGYIRTDEVSHYKHFYRYFKAYNASERLSRRKILGALLRRISEIENEDGYYAFKHVYKVRHPDVEFSDTYYKEFSHQTNKLAQRYFPYRTAVKMFLQPLAMGGVFKRVAVPVLEHSAKLVMFR